MSSKTWTLVAAVLGSSIVFLDSAVLTVALPAIGREPRLFLDVLEAQNYIQYGYLLSLSALLILAGALSDYYGRRRMFIIGLVGFGDHVAAVRPRAQPRAARSCCASAPGRGRCAARSRLAGDPDHELRR